MNIRSGSIAVTAALALAMVAPAALAFEGADTKQSDRFRTGKGELEIVFLGHASLVFSFGGKVIYVDPVGRFGDFAKMPKADLILITHEHGDHLDPVTIALLTGANTRLVVPQAVRAKIGKGEVLDHGEKIEAAGIGIEAVPAYNVSPDRLAFHPKERRDNGYLISAGGLRTYVAGDTEDIPEMAKLGPVDVAFLPMNQPYTMTPAQAAAAARMVKPAILYPYHFGDTDPAELQRLLESDKGIDVRVRELK